MSKNQLRRQSPTMRFFRGEISQAEWLDHLHARQVKRVERKCLARWRNENLTKRERKALNE